MRNGKRIGLVVSAVGLMAGLVCTVLPDAEAPTSAGLSVLSQGNSTFRTGEYVSSTLQPSAVRFGAFGQIGTYQVDGWVYAQPLIQEGVVIGGVSKNVLFIATNNNSLYAFDASSSTLPPIWHRDRSLFGTPFDNSSDDDRFAYGTGASGGRCHPHTMRNGILSTPVIDASTNTIYVVAWKDVGGGPPLSRSTQHVLYAIDTRTGNVLRQVNISGTAPGLGGATIAFNSFMQFQRPGLLLANNNIYVAFGGINDSLPYAGWVFGYVASTFAPVGAPYCTTCKSMTTSATSTCPLNVFPGTTGPCAGCDPSPSPPPNEGGGGIWQAGAGLMADTSGNVYFMTGNGNVDIPTTTSIAAVKLSPNLATATAFFPANRTDLNIADDDLASSGLTYVPAKSPAPAAVIGGGKEGVLYSLNPANMSLVHSLQATFNQEPGSNGFKSHIHGPPVQWSSQRKLFVCGERDYLRRFRLDSTNHLVADGVALSVAPAPIAAGTMPGGELALSVLSTDPAKAIVWMVTRARPWDANTPGGCVGTFSNIFCFHDDVGPGILRAIDANTLKELWHGERSFSMGKFPLFTIGLGKVFVPTFESSVIVYGPCTNCRNPASRMDYDADNVTDMALFDPAITTTYVRRSFTRNVPVPDQRLLNIPIGPPGVIPLSADFDGDGRADVATWDSPNHTLYYFPSGLETINGVFTASQTITPTYGTFVGISFGNGGDIPVPADYDGDGRADVAVRRDTSPDITTYILRSTDGVAVTVPFGNQGDVPIIGDFDGDNRSDVAVRRSSNGTFYVLRSSDGVSTSFPFGNGTDIPVVGDYDGDGKSDFAVWQDALSRVAYVRSSTGAVITVSIGQSGDVPIPGDYDGDGKTDVAIWNGSGAFFKYVSSRSGLTVQVFVNSLPGASSMIPVAQLIKNPGNPDIRGR